MLDPADFTDGGTARDAYLPLVLDPNTRHASTNDHSPPSHDTSDGNDHPSSCDVHGDGAASHAPMGAAAAVRMDVPFGSLASDAPLCASSARIETPSGAMHAHDSCMMHSEHTECSGANALIHAIGLAPQSVLVRLPSLGRLSIPRVSFAIRRDRRMNCWQMSFRLVMTWASLPVLRLPRNSVRAQHRNLPV